MDYEGIPFICGRYHSHGHIGMDFSKLFNRKKWVQKDIEDIKAPAQEHNDTSTTKNTPIVTQPDSQEEKDHSSSTHHASEAHKVVDKALNSS